MEPNDKEIVLGLDNLINKAKLQFVRGKHNSLPFEFISEEEIQARRGVTSGSSGRAAPVPVRGESPSRQPSEVDDPDFIRAMELSLQQQSEDERRRAEDKSIPKDVLRASLEDERRRAQRAEEYEPIPEDVLRASLESEKLRAQRAQVLRSDSDIRRMSEEEQMPLAMEESKDIAARSSVRPVLLSGHSKIKNVTTWDGGRYRLRVLHTPLDGNCMYHAVANTLTKHFDGDSPLGSTQREIINKLRLIASSTIIS